MVRRNTSLLPVQPVGIFFDGGPNLLRFQRQSRSQASHGARDVNAEQDAANIEDDGAELGDCHGLVALWMGSGFGASVAGSTERVPRAIDAYNRGKHGNHYNEDNDVMDALADIRDRTAQGVATKNHGADPKDPAKNVKNQIAGIRHLCCTGDWRTEGSHDGNKAGKDDSAAAIFFIEVMGALKMVPAEEKRIFAAVQSGAVKEANPVAKLVAHDGAEHHGQKKPLQGDDAGSGEYSRGDEQGITRKKKSYKKPRFDKDDRADKRRAA